MKIPVLNFVKYYIFEFLIIISICTTTISTYNLQGSSFPFNGVYSTSDSTQQVQSERRSIVNYVERKFPDSMSMADPKGLIAPKLNSKVKIPNPTPRDLNLNYNCKKNDTTTLQACVEYCTRFKDYREGVCSSDQLACICQTQGRNPIRVKLYKPSTPVVVKTKTKPSPARKVVQDRGDFDCDGSLEAKSICQVYCNLKGSSSSECTKDRKSCLCYASVPGKTSSSSGGRIHPRRRRQLLEEGEERLLGGIGMGRQRRPLPMLSSRPLPYLAGCNSYSCLGKCPRHCDSLCTMNMECFCSCPEDAQFYDYPDPYSPFGPSYDYPFYG